MYPDWVEKYHTKGTTIKAIKGEYYLYTATSKLEKGKKYPTAIQKYIGKITENGIIEPKKIYFTALETEIICLKDILNKNIDVDKKDVKILNNTYAVKKDNKYYLGKVTKQHLVIVEKYFNYKDGVITLG